MRKILAALFIVVFALAFACGLTTSQATASGCGNPGLCKFACIGGDTYICCCVNGEWACGLFEEGCGPPG
jgi:hypothetical protein